MAAAVHRACRIVVRRHPGRVVAGYRIAFSLSVSAMTDASISPSSPVPASTELGDVTRYLRERIRTVPDWPQPG